MTEATELLLTRPDELVATLLPGIEDRVLAAGEAFDRIVENRAILPLAVRAGRGGPDLIHWADLSGASFDEWQMMFSLEAMARTGRIRQSFSTSVELLDRRPPDAVDPSGLVFHMSRCGSTLVSRALARSSRHLVHSQPGVLRDGIWSLLTNGWATPPPIQPAELDRFRNLVGYLLRPTPGAVSASFVKLYSENVAFLDFIRSAFPDTPAIFLYRDPVEVLASVAGNGTGMLEARGTTRAELVAGLDPGVEPTLTDSEFLVACFGRYFDVVLDHDRPGLTPVEYPALRPDTFVRLVADGFGHQLPAEDLDQILGQFSHHAKSPSAAPRTFRPDSDSKRARVSPADHRLVQQRLSERLDRLRQRSWSPPVT